jgi:hypothetical protein
VLPLADLRVYSAATFTAFPGEGENVKKFVAFIAALALAGAGLLGLAGAANAAPVHKGSVFLHLFADTAHPTSVVSLSGLVRGSNGTDHVVSSTKDVFGFKHGKVYVTHHATRTVNKSNARTCAESSTETGKYTITKGTGRYFGLSGKGRYLAIFTGRAPRKSNGKCNFKANPKTFTQNIWASGPASI